MVPAASGNYYNFSGEPVAQSMPYRITPNGGKQYSNTNLFEYAIQCDPNKTVKSLTVPDKSNVRFTP